MTRNTSLLLIIWNVLLTVLLGWTLMRTPATTNTSSTNGIPLEEDGETAVVVPSVIRDSSALKDARIAYFRMDTLQRRFELIKEKDNSFRSEGKRLEDNLKKELEKAQQRYEELMTKDQTYSTNEEKRRDEAELQQLGMRVQQLQAQGEDQLARLEASMLQEISDELKAFLEEYNKQAGFDYIFSVQNGGQVWVGNENLDITDDLVNGLNARHRARKATRKK
ncbi:MAG: OmpH family outer membrane protein [Flavobacteriales bacterium]|jgi:outer membrane protein